MHRAHLLRDDSLVRHAITQANAVLSGRWQRDVVGSALGQLPGRHAVQEEIMIKIDIDIRGLDARSLLESKRLAYATTTAINRTMLEIQREERAELDRRFTIRKNAFVYGLIKIFVFAKVFKGIGPQQVYGEMGIDHKSRTLLDQFVEGGIKEPAGKSLGVPITGSAARPSFSDPVTAALQLAKINLHPRVLKDGTTQLISEQDGGIFSLPNVRHGTTPRGLFQKTGDVIRALYLFIPHPVALSRRYDFLGIAERVYNEVFDREFDRAYKSR
jgi:hypothetical protein